MGINKLVAVITAGICLVVEWICVFAGIKEGVMPFMIMSNIWIATSIVLSERKKDVEDDDR